ncbi:RNA-binding protein 39-like isoform X3 [Babylonia areolata]
MSSSSSSSKNKKKCHYGCHSVIKRELEICLTFPAEGRKEAGAAVVKKSHRDSGREKRSRSKERERNRGGERREKRRSRSRERERGRRDEREGHRSPAGRGRRGGFPFRRSRSRERHGGKRGGSPPSQRGGEEQQSHLGGTPGLTPEERDIRTVFCMQLAAKIRARDLEEFFSSVGKVTDVRMITDSKTRRSKGIAYIEFKDIESVPLAMALSGQKLLGVPILVQATQSERNRMAMASSMMAANSKAVQSGPMRLYVGSLHYNITEDMLKGIFEPFGKVDDVKLMRDHETGRSHGYGFLTFRNPDDAKKAMEQLNGFELAGRPMKVGNVTERTGGEGGPFSNLDTDEMDRAGIGLGATGRLQLMAKLAEGTGFKIPQYAANALSQASNNNPAAVVPPTATPPFPPLPSAAAGTVGASSGVGAPPIATQCFMLSNMFDLSSENRANWDQEVRDDVIEECNKHGGVLHIFVDKSTPQGNVYVKCPTISAAIASVNSLHGRYFGGRVITAAYVPLPNYSSLFVDSVRASQPLMPSSQALSSGFSAGLMSIPPSLR